MRYVIAWEPLPNTSEEMQARALQVFGKWSPAEGSNFLQFLNRIDGRGGFAVVETEDPTLVTGDTGIFGTSWNLMSTPPRQPGVGPDRWRSGRVPPQHWLEAGHAGTLPPSPQSLR
jgi:hypothetical protein